MALRKLPPALGAHIADSSSCAKCWSGDRLTGSSLRTGLRRQSSISRVTDTSQVVVQKAKEKQADREFFIDLLSSAATKRDAKAYISRLNSTSSDGENHNLASGKSQSSRAHQTRPGVNLGSFFGSATAVEQSPRFSQFPRDQDNASLDVRRVHHLAIVKLLGPETLDQEVLLGTGLTLSQLCRLGMTPCVVIEPMNGVQFPQSSGWRELMAMEAERLTKAIVTSSGVEARILDSAFIQTHFEAPPRIFSRKPLLGPIRTGQIPIILPCAYVEESQSMCKISAEQAILALCQDFAQYSESSPDEQDAGSVGERAMSSQDGVSVDRLIILDPHGGIPHPAMPGANHVFLNMRQEFDDVQRELLARSVAATTGSGSDAFNSGNINAIAHSGETFQGDHEIPNPLHHLQNLELVRTVLNRLPGTSSAIITSPLEAARSSGTSSVTDSVSAVGTRPRKNPLIYNLLTDKPTHSASLPPGRLGLPRSNINNGVATSVSDSTFAKKGMALTMTPDPRKSAWKADDHDRCRIKLSNPKIDLARLVYLINDSFNRQLDVERYLERVDDRIAGIIIAGEYEGAAIFTWETPPGVARDDWPRQVPYLDKFAVLKRSQGSGGVADVLFNAMVRGCLPSGVCWRSRRDNPVNKWYFERARGTWKVPNTNWTMFWTTEDVEGGSRQKFEDYEAVCRTVQPTWADHKKIED